MAKAEPLAVRMRPQRIEDFVGQGHFLGSGKLLTRMLAADRLSSLIFYGRPGTGKTSLAMIIAGFTNAEFETLNAPAATVKDIREIISKARDRLAAKAKRTILFIDEIHRFNRGQQDVLLDDVEKGIIVLIGATTENPFFSVNSPLISRSTVFHFESIGPDDIVKLLERAITDAESGLGRLQIDADKDALKYLAEICDGDARKALNALEIGILSQHEHGSGKKIKFDLETAAQSVQKKAIHYDKSGDTHYDLASALQKSMRGSDPDATVYWLSRMIAGGEDIRFIARRIAICAAEDVGNADPVATMLAAAAVQMCEFVGLPEAQLHLAQAAIYVACAPKSNACASAVWKATGDVNNEPTLAVPMHLRDAHYKAAKKMGIGSDYKYPHDFEGGFVPQEYFPSGIKKKYYVPKQIGREKNIRLYLNQLKSMKKNSKLENNNIGKDKTKDGQING